MQSLSVVKRKELLTFLERIKGKLDSEDIKYLSEVECYIANLPCGLCWEEHAEPFDLDIRHKVPVLKEDTEKKIVNAPQKPMNFLLEGDNLYTLQWMNKTFERKIDLILIDPPYNRGKNDLCYDDTRVDTGDTFSHSKWLSFMNKRLVLARSLLSDTGIIAIHIDEHEMAPLILLMEEIFGETNNLGTIIWNKQNPKGDVHKISVMHEYIIVFAKDYERIKGKEGYLKRRKPDARVMLAKAKQLYGKIGKECVPDVCKRLAKVYGYPREMINAMKVKYDLAMVNREFVNWLATQNFSAGEKAYKYIDENGRVYRGASMAWPNKKRAPDDYFIPLVHPVTGKRCPVPARGWRNPPQTMDKLLQEGRILFGKDEKKQPERKYFLDENLMENVPSIYNNADSADSYMRDLGFFLIIPNLYL